MDLWMGGCIDGTDIICSVVEKKKHFTTESELQPCTKSHSDETTVLMFWCFYLKSSIT